MEKADIDNAVYGELHDKNKASERLFEMVSSWAVDYFVHNGWLMKYLFKKLFSEKGTYRLIGSIMFIGIEVVVLTVISIDAIYQRFFHSRQELLQLGFHVINIKT